MTVRQPLLFALALACGLGPLAAAAADHAADSGPVVDPSHTASAGDVTFEWKDVPIAVVVQAILGDIHGAAFEIAPGVEGRVTYTTPKPIGRWEALALLEKQLAANGAVLVSTGRGYIVEPVVAVNE